QVGKSWRKMPERFPIGVAARFAQSLYAAASPAGNVLAHVRIPEHAASSLPDRKAPVWAFLHGLKSPLSSTALRALRRQRGTSDPAARTPKSSKSRKSKTSSKKKRGNKGPKRKLPAKVRKRRARKKQAR